jgi:hypothetical protein
MSFASNESNGNIYFGFDDYLTKFSNDNQLQFLQQQYQFLSYKSNNKGKNQNKIFFFKFYHLTET